MLSSLVNMLFMESIACNFTGTQVQEAVVELDIPFTVSFVADDFVLPVIEEHSFCSYGEATVGPDSTSTSALREQPLSSAKFNTATVLCQYLKEYDSCF